MEVLESRHKSELITHYKSQERELEQLRSNYERDLERLRSRQRAEGEQRVKYEANDERKFLKSVKEKQDAEMKHFLAQQKADYRATKGLFKKVKHVAGCHPVAIEVVELKSEAPSSIPGGCRFFTVL